MDQKEVAHNQYGMPFLKTSESSESPYELGFETNSNDINERMALFPEGKEIVGKDEREKDNDRERKEALFAKSRESVGMDEMEKKHDLEKRIALCQLSTEGKLPGQQGWTPSEGIAET